jgi:dehydrogenase/reductase SDR family member 7B
MKFSQQVVWLTGASSGIGEALAHAFAREGARLVLSSRRVDELERVRLACARSDDHIVLPLDLARSESFAAATGEVLARCGRIDILVNNGGVSQRALAKDASLEVERALMEVNYFGPVALTKSVLPVMRAQGSGHVVVISSVMGYLGTPGRSTYAAAKHALHGWFDSLRGEVWREGIRVLLVCPGYVKTAVSVNALGPDGVKHARLDMKTARGIPPEECAAAVIRGMVRNREEIYVGGFRDIAAIYLKRFAPRLLSRIIRKMTFSVSATTR